MWMTRRRSLGWIRSSVWLHCCSFISFRRFLRSKNEMMQLAGIQKIAVNTTTVTASGKNINTNRYRKGSDTH